MPYESQAKLLRVLQEKQVRPVGGLEETPVDVRVIASTNHNVDEAISNNELRKDLYYRISVIRIKLPPLRLRPDDIPVLINHFIAKFNNVFKKSIKAIDKDAMDLLTHYHWPGNVRELESAIENSFAFANFEMIHKVDLPAYIIKCLETDKYRLLADREGISVSTLFESEKKLLVRALKVAKGNKTRAAKLLGISRPRLYKMIQRYGIRG